MKSVPMQQQQQQQFDDVSCWFSIYFSPSPPKEPEKEVLWSEVESDVVHLTDATFDEFLSNNPSVLIMFYAPCRAL